jgi:hypothetical protein
MLTTTLSPSSGKYSELAVIQPAECLSIFYITKR